MKTERLGTALLSLAIIALAGGCVERQVVQVPVYQPQPVYVPPPPPPAPGTVIVVQSPPRPQPEVIPASPGPNCVWTPGYWAWRGQWVWIRGAWIVRPRPHATWVAGHWARHERGYVWIDGHWR
jgi:hypothetical protein